MQNGVGIAGGISITAFGVQATLDAYPNFRLIQCDLNNGCNEISEGILNAMCDTGKLNNMLAFSQAPLEPRTYIGMCSGTGVSKAPFLCEEGVHQGAIESSVFCSWTQHNIQDTNKGYGYH